MKKIASVLLAVLVAISMFTFMATAAAPTLSLKADKTTVNVGDTVTVKLNVSSNSKLCVLTAEVKYDVNCFELVSATPVKGFAEPIINKNIAGKVIFAGASSSSIADDVSTLLEVQFKVLKAGGEIALNVTEAYVAVGEIDADNVTTEVAKSTNTVKFEAAELPTEPEKPTEPEQPTEHKHEYSEAKVTKEATCTEAGEKVASCKICGDKLVSAIPATGKHTAGKWEVTKAATTKTAGEKVKKCTSCGTVLEKASIPKLSSGNNGTQVIGPDGQLKPETGIVDTDVK